MDHATAMDPVDATQPTVAMAPVNGNGSEPCPHCGTPLALDQRYCLECGAPRTYLSGMLLERLQTPPTQTPPVPPPAQSSSSQGWQRGSALTLIASIGVLLLAMGVGVLIGRSGGSSSAAAPPQVITVGGAATGAANATPTPTTPAENPAAKAAAAAAAGAKHKPKEPGVGATPGKPAPPTVLKNLRTGSGQSYEQKSKNLPNVVSTG